MSSHYGITVRPNISLPNEVLYEIFHNLPASVLAVIACVSHRFNAVAEHILYSSISLRDVLSQSSPYPWRTRLCCESIIQRTHLVESIRGFHVRWQADVQPPSSQFDFSPTVMKLTEALRILTSLESLELWLGPANYKAGPLAPHVVERIIQGAHFPQLVSVSLGAEWTKGSPLYSNILDTFLGSLNSLRHLKLPDHHTALNLPLDSLPILSSFRGSPATSASLLPGRPVRYLSLVGDDYDVDQEILTRLASTTEPLRVLDLSSMSVRPVILRNLATHLPAIEVLKVRLALRHTLHYALTGIRLLTGLSSVLSTFHSLIHLDLSPTSVAGADAQQEMSLCDEWTRACPSLRRITFPSHIEWVLGSDKSWLSQA
ncbi:hypothetical protein GYMLUDRAFT_43832 [Collybiopsis luxurians FD-317 M1]|uniref:F-box domain-containing protein n=1 Tax=Collybiopsis luxurians FD-317 M1 TaxID=944289 RepID=A0A0D0CDG6_9AGAR|nr:hypothetical protein GYMLUDRAFT_43832 [Collybiopsis luxurians FD-317 M1]